MDFESISLAARTHCLLAAGNSKLWKLQWLALGQVAMLSFLLKGRYEHCRAEQSRQGPGQSRQGPGRAEQQRAAQGIVGHKQGRAGQHTAEQGSTGQAEEEAQSSTGQNRAEQGREGSGSGVGRKHCSHKQGCICVIIRQRGDSNPCGQSPMDFESISLAARTHCHLVSSS